MWFYFFLNGTQSLIRNKPGVASRAAAAPERVNKPFSLRNLFANEAEINDE